MDFSSICTSSVVDFSTVRVEVGYVWWGSSQLSQQVAQKTALVCRQIKTSTGEPVSEGGKHS